MEKAKHSTGSTIQFLVGLLREEADQLDRWAVESQDGGWSTHQAGPMRERAATIRAALIRAEKANKGDET